MLPQPHAKPEVRSTVLLAQVSVLPRSEQPLPLLQGRQLVGRPLTQSGIVIALPEDHLGAPLDLLNPRADLGSRQRPRPFLPWVASSISAQEKRRGLGV